MRFLIEMKGRIKNTGEDAIDEGRLTWHLYTDMRNQFVDSFDVFPPARVTEQLEKNMVATLNLPELSPGESFNPTVILRLDTTTRDWLMEANGTNYAALRELQQQYCNPDKYWEIRDPLVNEIAEHIKRAADEDESLSRLVFELAKQRIKLRRHLAERKGAARALREEEGDCDECADIFVAVARSIGMPARRVVGHLFKGNSKPEPHAWSEVFIHNRGWVPIDASLGSFGILNEKYFSRIREGLVSERPSFSVKLNGNGSNRVDISEQIRMSVVSI
ncbi:MAG: transglutaminase domain-containing protein [Candidatus Thorarchaeota archaeon]